jgi:hypothetical protein
MEVGSSSLTGELQDRREQGGRQFTAVAVVGCRGGSNWSRDFNYKTALTIIDGCAKLFPKWEGQSLSRRVDLVPVFVVSNRLGLSVGFLDYARRGGFGPPYLKVGEEALYDWPKVVAWSARCGLSLSELNGPAGSGSAETMALA